MADDLKRINGIGKILEKRLQEAGLESYAQLAQADPNGLAALPGVNKGAAKRIIEQAARLSGHDEDGFQRALDILMPICEKLMNEIQGLAQVVKDRDLKDIPKKHHRQIENEIERIFGSLKTIKSNLIGDLTRVGREIAKADRKIGKLDTQDDPEHLRKGLKKVRRKLEKALEE